MCYQCEMFASRWFTDFAVGLNSSHDEEQGNSGGTNTQLGVEYKAKSGRMLCNLLRHLSQPTCC